MNRSSPITNSNQGSRPVTIFFSQEQYIFSRAKFLARRARNLAGPRKTKLLRIPAAGPASTHPEQNIFSQSAKKISCSAPHWPAAGRSGSAYKGFPIGETPAGLPAAKKISCSALGPPGHAKKISCPASLPPALRKKKLLRSWRPAAPPLRPSKIFFREKSCWQGIWHRPWIPA